MKNIIKIRSRIVQEIIIAISSSSFVLKSTFLSMSQGIADVMTRRKNCQISLDNNSIPSLSSKLSTNLQGFVGITNYLTDTPSCVNYHVITMKESSSQSNLPGIQTTYSWPKPPYLVSNYSSARYLKNGTRYLFPFLALISIPL